MTTTGAVTSSAATIFKKFTLTLWFACVVTSLLNILFGYDTTSFSGVQAIPGFVHHFQPDVDGVPATTLSPGRASFMSSTAFIGKLLGVLTIPYFIEIVGHKVAIWATSIVSIVGIIIECTAGPEGQFVFGRIVVYFSVGMAEVAATTYQAEVVPAGARGAIVGSIQLFNQVGQVMAAGINYSYHLHTDEQGWIIPVALSALAPAILIIGTFFIPLGPRWLISKGRKPDAVKVLEKIRDKRDVASGRPQREADAIEEALENKLDKGPWLDLFRGTNLRRTGIAASIYVLQQVTGQGFVTQYGPRFYALVGLSDYAFQYTIGGACMGFAGCLIGTLTIDRFGRRPLLLIGATGQAICLFIIAGIGQIETPTLSSGHALVAAVFFFLFFYFGFWAGPSYVIGGEIGTASLREKTQSFTIALNVVAAWLVAFNVPYILDRIGPNIGWVFGSISTFAIFYTYFFVPELQNRSLEEIDELFELRIPARQFERTETHGAGRRVAMLENLGSSEDLTEEETVHPEKAGSV